MFVQSIARQYEEVRKQETKLARQLHQGPPDSVIKIHSVQKCNFVRPLMLNHPATLCWTISRKSE